MKNSGIILPVLLVFFLTASCQPQMAKSENKKAVLTQKEIDLNMPEGMVWIPGGAFKMGAVPQDKMAMNHEKPSHEVRVDGFYMDATEVTNAQFKKFIDATNYKTLAERAVDWEELKKQVPPGTIKPHDSILKPGSLVFKKTKSSVSNLYDFSQWWKWKIGANWKHPNGPESSIKGKENHPVVHIAYEDALAYCEWSGHRLPTEAEWERAARGTKTSTFWWGDNTSTISKHVNSWEGEFPVRNSATDGFERTAPVKSYPANEYGLFEISGNVWEWTSDWYNTEYYAEAAKLEQSEFNPKGAAKAFNENNPYAKEKVIKGGSFLCNTSYCASYRISARMATTIDSSLEHLGFRTVVTPAMLSE